MTDTLKGTKCPRECRVRLNHIENRLDKGETIHEGLWGEVKSKVSQKTFFWIMGIAVLILMATFGAIYRQGDITLEKVQAAQTDLVRVESQLENHTENTVILKELLQEIKEENSLRKH